MSSPIEKVSFYLYRNDTNTLVQDSIELEYDSEKDGVYTFTAVFNPTLNSSFGLDLNAFRVHVEAIDEATNFSFIDDEHIPENENPDNFSTKVRVKEKTTEEERENFKPSITTKDWPDRCKDRDFEAVFLIQDINISNGSNFRPAGIDKNKLEIYVDGELQDLPKPVNEYFENIETAATSLGTDEIYKLTYVLNTVIDDIYNIKIKVWDNDGHSAEFQRDILIDASAPAITLEELDPYLNVNNFTIQGTVDSLATVRISIIKNGIELEPDLIKEEELQYSEELKKYIYSKDYFNQEDGHYKVVVAAYDRDGSFSDNLITEFVVDSQAPIFKSIKFYPINSNTPLDFSKGDTISKDLQYKIVVEVI